MLIAVRNSLFKNGRSSSRGDSRLVEIDMDINTFYCHDEVSTKADFLTTVCLLFSVPVMIWMIYVWIAWIVKIVRFSLFNLNFLSRLFWFFIQKKKEFQVKPCFWKWNRESNFWKEQQYIFTTYSYSAWRKYIFCSLVCDYTAI